MTVKEMLEQEEHQRLDPRAAFCDQSRGRPRRELPRENDVRTCYQRDTDRIVHSKSFRRLKHKTQVFLSPEGDRPYRMIPARTASKYASGRPRIAALFAA